MSESIWHSYAERKPTAEDADAEGFVTILNAGTLWPRSWNALAWASRPLPWARTADVLRATGYVKPRKLHPAWRELREDSWDGFQWRWMLDGSGDGAVQLMYTKAGGAHHDGWTHWQPCDLPPVWEDET